MIYLELSKHRRQQSTHLNSFIFMLSCSYFGIRQSRAKERSWNIQYAYHWDIDGRQEVLKSKITSQANKKYTKAQLPHENKLLPFSGECDHEEYQQNCLIPIRNNFCIK